ncbi:hypothetical protein MBLNU230_g6000t1 [Neophaeotheca triangularis]
MSGESSRLDLDHYAVLGLTGKEGKSLSAQEVKQAYKRALLAHHPDKSAPPKSGSSQKPGGRKVTVDDIALAYKILSEPRLKAEYDHSLNERAVNGGSSDQVYHTGLETVDLDDLEMDEHSVSWTRGCRCGKANAYVVTETELDKNLADGELITGCRGCSLWLRVLFGVEDSSVG